MIELDPSHPAAPELAQIEHEYLSGLRTREEAVQESVAVIRRHEPDAGPRRQ